MYQDKLILRLYLSFLISLSLTGVIKGTVSNAQNNINAQQWNFFPAPDPERFMSTPEIIKYHGYPVEEHDVTTEDGYVLRIHRIPYGKQQYHGENRKPVLLQHGLTCTSALWVMNIPENNLAYRLADSGHDVWLANARGNKYGLNHVNMSIYESEFWRFSYHEMGVYDLPATIDFILQKTGHKKIGFVGLSQGASVVLVTLSVKPEYNEKIHVAVLLGPAADMHYMSSPLRYLWIFEPFYILCPTCANSDYDPGVMITRLIGTQLCSYPAFFNLCQLGAFIVGGFDDVKMLNASRLPVFFSHFPDMTSYMNVLHCLQTTNGFRMFDHGKKWNLELYGQPTPPLYNLSRITAPLAIFWSEGDIFTTTLDTTQLFRQLKGPVIDCFVPDVFSHPGFIIRTDVNEVLNDKVLKLIDDNQFSNITKKL